MPGVGCTYEEWVEALNTESWSYIGEWAYPKRENGSYADVFYHWCGDRERKAPGYPNLQPDRCQYCDAEVPESIQMIVLLTEKL